MIKKLILILLVAAGIFIFAEKAFYSPEQSNDQTTLTESENSSQNDSQKLLAFAYQSQQSDIQVQGKGQVVKLLKDDNQGSRHQRFIIRLASGQTLLVAHNIDLAPRVPQLKSGDEIAFFGEYEWNDKGGVIHWTHKDPHGQHIAGWLKHQGKLYQ